MPQVVVKECERRLSGRVAEQVERVQTALGWLARFCGEVRLNVEDKWYRTDSDEPLEFRLSGSCQYHLADGELRELSATNLGLYMTKPEGTKRAVKGSYVHLSAHFYAGAPPIRPEPAPVGGATGPA